MAALGWIMRAGLILYSWFVSYNAALLLKSDGLGCFMKNEFWLVFTGSPLFTAVFFYVIFLLSLANILLVFFKKVKEEDDRAQNQNLHREVSCPRCSEVFNAGKDQQAHCASCGKIFSVAENKVKWTQ